MADKEEPPTTGAELNSQTVGKLATTLYFNDVIDGEDLKFVFSHIDGGEEMIDDFLDKQEER